MFSLCGRGGVLLTFEILCAIGLRDQVDLQNKSVLQGLKFVRMWDRHTQVCHAPRERGSEKVWQSLWQGERGKDHVTLHTFNFFTIHNFMFYWHIIIMQEYKLQAVLTIHLRIL